MAPSYKSIDERNAGREAMLEKEASSRAELKAGEINQAKENQLIAEQENLDTIAQAKESGFQRGHRAATVDATRFFADQGFIPGQIADVARMEYDQGNAAEEQNAGLGMSEASNGGAIDAQANDISTKLLEASMQGAPDAVINQTLSGLDIPDQVKSAAAQMFVSKRKDVGSQGMPQENASAQLMKAKPTAITQKAHAIDQETDQRMQQLHQMLNPQPQEQGQQQQ